MSGQETAIMYEWIRAFHIIFVIFWMAGLLYLPRLFVYHSQAKIGGELDETLKVQERKLLRVIMNPAMILAFVFGLWIIWIRRDNLFDQYWIYAKLFFVFILLGYHGFLSKMRKQFETGARPKSEKFFRVFNEFPAILTIIIVILAVIEPF